jgi:hypothetical protein
MIVAETDDGYQFVTQPAHARLAGRFADHWDSEAFADPEPDAAVRIAAYEHDVGWWRYDRRPHLTDGQPVDFREMDAATWTTFYDDGVDTVAAMDRYAGLLVSMHGSGLRRRRYGLSPSWPETPDPFRPFVERAERRQARLLDELRSEGDERVSDADVRLLSTLHESGSPDGEGSRLWRHYKLLQAWDALSLAFCVTTSPPGYPRIDGIPAADTGANAELSLEPTANGEYRLDPYPFDESPLRISVPTRAVGTHQFDDETELVRAFYRAGSELKSFRLRQPEH